MELGHYSEHRGAIAVYSHCQSRVSFSWAVAARMMTNQGVTAAEVQQQAKASHALLHVSPGHVSHFKLCCDIDTRERTTCTASITAATFYLAAAFLQLDKRTIPQGRHRTASSFADSARGAPLGPENFM